MKQASGVLAFSWEHWLLQEDRVARQEGHLCFIWDAAMVVGTCVMMCVPCGPRGALGVGRSFIRGLSLRFCPSRCVWGEGEMYVMLGADRSGYWVNMCEFLCAMRSDVEREGFVGIVVESVGCVLGTCITRVEGVIITCVESWVFVLKM